MPLALKLRDLSEEEQARLKKLACSRTASTQLVERTWVKINYERRGKGYIIGAFRPASGEAFPRDYRRRTIINFVDFLEQTGGPRSATLSNGRSGSPVCL